MTMIKCLEMTIIGKCLFLLIPELTVFIFILLPKYLTLTSSKFLTFITIAQIMKSFTTIQDFWIHFCCLPKFRNDLKKEFSSIVEKCGICVRGLNSQKKILLGKHTFTDDTENVKSVMRVDKSQAPGLNPRRRASRNSVNSVFSAPYSSHPNICEETLRRAYSDDPSNIIKCEMAIRRQSLRTSSLRRGF